MSYLKMKYTCCLLWGVLKIILVYIDVVSQMVPKTSYLKMIDYWLLYSFNIMIVIMGVHTWMDSSITRGVTKL